MDKVGSDEVKKEAGKPADCSDIADDGKAELTRLRSLLSELNAKEGSPENPTAENPTAETPTEENTAETLLQKILQKMLTQPQQMRLQYKRTK